MKKIIVQWYKTVDDKMYDKEMRIIYSTHKRFTEGTRFDFGFMTIASSEGYIVELWPLPEPK